MSRTRVLMTLGGVTLIAGAAGCALGLLAAPVAGKELRRRLAWRAEEEWRGASRASRAYLDRLAGRARDEFAQRRARVREVIAAD